MSKTAVIALGGNALLRGDQKGTYQEQAQNIKETLENLIPLLKRGDNLVIGHGNGPQVGNLLMQHAAGEELFSIPSFPLDVCVAQTEGSIGYMLELELRNLLVAHGIKRDVCTILTPVVVDLQDAAFADPTKRVGRVYSEEQANALRAERGWQFKEEVRTTGTGWRRVVPSPAPVEVVNAPLVKQLAEQGTIVIAVGGGGIPIAKGADGVLSPVEAVIDKDSATALLASSIKAHEFYILTDVPFVYLNFRQPDEQKLERVSLEQIEQYLEAGMFGEGNMAPKIRACASFLTEGGETSIITEATKLTDKAFGTRITH